MIVVDTSVFIDYFRDIKNPLTEYLDNAIEHEDIITLDVVLCELLLGTQSDKQAAQIHRALLNTIMADAGGSHNAVKAASNYRTLRHLGITPRSTIDVLIATFCIENNHILLHRDRDFDAFEKHLGLRVAHPA